jgi:hypothetical protein
MRTMTLKKRRPMNDERVASRGGRLDRKRHVGKSSERGEGGLGASAPRGVGVLGYLSTFQSQLYVTPKIG